MNKRRDYHFCPICGAALDAGESCTDCKRLQEKAERIGYSVRAKAHKSGVFELLNEYGFVIGEGNDVDKLGDFLDLLARAPARPFFGGIS